MTINKMLKIKFKKNHLSILKLFIFALSLSCDIILYMNVAIAACTGDNLSATASSDYMHKGTFTLDYTFSVVQYNNWVNSNYPAGVKWSCSSFANVSVWENFGTSYAHRSDGSGWRVSDWVADTSITTTIPHSSGVYNGDFLFMPADNTGGYAQHTMIVTKVYSNGRFDAVCYTNDGTTTSGGYKEYTYRSFDSSIDPYFSKTVTKRVKLTK
jgi:hypothetical protein